MISRKEYNEAQKKAGRMMRQAGIVITDKEIESIEVADFGLGNLYVEGSQILTFFNTERVSAKIIVLFPGQTLPEHWHTSFGNDAGKEETFRIIQGTLYMFLPGEDTIALGAIPAGKDACYTVRQEIVMEPCSQLTLEPGTKHWFQAGPEGAVLYSFSSCARDTMDPFTDPNIIRVTKIIE